MNYTKILSSVSILILVAILLTGCTEGNQNSRVSYDYNMEGSLWKDSPGIIQFPEAHSGTHVCKINKENAFSSSMDIRVKDISKMPLKKARITAWFMLTSNASEQNLVLDVRDSTLQNSFEWINTDAANYIAELNKWAKVEMVVDLTKNDRNNMNNVYRIYAANGKDEPVYVDDFEVSFEE